MGVAAGVMLLAPDVAFHAASVAVSRCIRSAAVCATRIRTMCVQAGEQEYGGGENSGLDVATICGTTLPAGSAAVTFTITSRVAVNVSGLVAAVTIRVRAASSAEIAIDVGGDGKATPTSRMYPSRHTHPGCA